MWKESHNYLSSNAHLKGNKFKKNAYDDNNTYLYMKKIHFIGILV